MGNYVHIVGLILLCMFFQGGLTLMVNDESYTFGNRITASGFDPEQSTVFNFKCGTELNHRDCLFWRFYRKNFYGDNSLVKELASHIM